MATGVRVYRDGDIDQGRLRGKTIACIGYGSQGRGQSLNLRDSGGAGEFEVVLGLREGGMTWKQAEGDGWSPLPVGEAVARADMICVLIPDMSQKEAYERQIAPNMKDGVTLLFSHGLAIVYGLIDPPASSDVVMIAPKGPGGLVRREYERGGGVPGLVAVHQDASGNALTEALCYGWAVGCGRGAIIETTFRDETETDLFGEQAVLCGGATSLIAKGFEVLTEAGYPPEIAYFECLHELKLIVDLIYEGGFERMHRFVSDTAQYGDHTRGDRVINEETKARMKEVLEEIRSGAFAREWIAEHEAGARNFKRMQDEDATHPVETIGRELRTHMSWLEKKD